MKKYLLLLTVFGLICCQNKTKELNQDKANTDLKPSSEFYPKDRTQVLVVGTFHFDYPGLDDLKTGESDKIDVLKEPKKSEVTELVAYIKKFKPTKIAIEAFPGYGWNQKFKEYKEGKHRNQRGERYQLAMRIALENGLDTLYTVDAASLKNDLYERDSLLLNSFTDKIDWNTEDPYWDYAEEYFEYKTAQIKNTPLLEYFKHQNTREAHNANLGLYLTGGFASGDGQGADHFSIWWYNRNARIFANIINITEHTEDRILVIFGNGHAAILRQLFEASPQYDYIEFDSLE